MSMIKVDGAFGYATAILFIFIVRKSTTLAQGVLSGLLPVTWLSIEIFWNRINKILYYGNYLIEKCSKYTILASSEAYLGMK